MSETRTLKVVVVGNAKSARAALKELGNESDTLGRKSKSSGMKFGATMAKMGKSAALGFGVATAAAGAFIYKVGAPYEQSLNKIQALNDQTDTQMKGIAKRLESQAGTFGQYGLSVGDAANGVVELSKAGMKLDAAMLAVNGTMVLAKAGGLEVADASALVSNTLNTYALKANKAAEVSNVFANAANISSSDVEDLAFGMSMTSNVAANMGISLQDTAGTLAMFSNAGLKGSDAGTSMKTMLMALIPKSEEAGKLMDSLGFNAFDAQGNFVGLAKTADKLRTSMKGMTQEQRMAAMKTMFGSDAIRAANILWREGGKGVEKYSKGVNKAGAAQKLAKSASSGLSGTVAKLKANFTSLGQIAYRALAPIANKALKPLADGVGKLPGMVAPAGKAVGKMFASMESGGKSGEMSKTFAALKQTGATLLPVLKEIGGKVMAAVIPAFKQVSALFTGTLLPAFRSFLPVITPVIAFLMRLVGGALIGVFKGAVNVIKGAMKIVAGIMNVITGLLTGNWSKAWEGMKQILSGVIQAIWGAIQIWWNMGILSVFRKGFAMLTKGIWVKGWNALKSIGSKSLSALKSAISKVFNFLTAPFRRAFATTKGYVTSGWAFIRGKFSGGVGTIGAIIKRIITVVTYPYRQAFALAKGIVTGGWSAVRGKFASGIETVMGIMKGLPGKIKGALSGAVTWLKSAGQDVIRGLVNGLEAAKQWVIDKIQEIADKIPGWVKKRLGIASPSKVMAALGKWITIGLAKGIGHAPSVKAMQKVLEKLADKVRNAFKHKSISADTKNDLLRILNKNEALINNAVKRRLKVTAKLDKAEAELKKRKDRLASLQEMKSGLIDSIKSNTSDFGSVLNAMGGEGEVNNPAYILARLQGRLDNIRQFRQNLTTLRSKGLNNNFLAQIAGAGPDTGGAIAAAIANSSVGEIANFNGLDAAITSEGNGMALENGAIYNAEIKAANTSAKAQQTVVNHIKVEVKGSVTAENDLAKKISKTIRDELERNKKRNNHK